MSQSPNSSSPVNSTETANPSPVITNATPITMIHPSFASALNPKPKKTTANRSSPFKTPKSKKNKTSSSSVSKKTSKKKGSKSKSKSIRTMQELYLDNVAEENVESRADVFEKSDSDLNVEGNKSDFVAETLETQKGVTGDNSIVAEVVGEGIVQDSPDAEETMDNQVVEDALNSLKDTIPKPNVAPDVATSLAQEEPTPDIVGDVVNADEQVDEEPATDEIVVPQVEKEPVVDEEEQTDIPTADNAMSVDDDVVDEGK
ncbi:hypothetical protein QL285_008656 [Trifolium repens]|nr:hypothetical protein QL285_008656 [Trifolium repens]